MTAPFELSVLDAAADIRAGRLSATGLVEACLARIDACETDVQAWVAVDRQGALAAARRLDADAREGRFHGPLHGVPIGLKDIIDAAGLTTTAGARGFADTTPREDATCVARLRSAGAVILGKLQTTEFAFSDPAVTRNPWHASRTPGGSSSGSAAAVAARMVPAALGSQTLGSVLRPAAFCGVVGLKPTYGRVSRRGVVPLSWSLDHVGVFARSVVDAALVMSAAAGYDPADPGSATAPPADVTAVLAGRRRARRGWGSSGSRFSRGRRPRPDPISTTLRGCSGHGGPRSSRCGSRRSWRRCTRRSSPSPERRSARSTRTRTGAARTPTVRGSGPGSRSASAFPPISTSGPSGSGVGRVWTWARSLARYDALVMPSALGPAPDRSTTGDAAFNGPWTGLGLPSVSVPTGLAAEGLPLGTQLIGGPFEEARLLTAARWVESALGFTAAPAIES